MQFKFRTYNYYRTQIPNEPSFKFNANAAYTWTNALQKGSRLSLYFNLGYIEGFLRNWSNVGSSNLKRIPTQAPFDAGVTYTFPRNKITLNLDAKNIFDRQLYDSFEAAYADGRTYGHSIILDYYMKAL